MQVHEPEATALALLTVGVLMALSALFSRASGRFGVPIAMLFVVIGMFAGIEGVGGIYFDDYTLKFGIGTVALVAILFGGRLRTPLAAVKAGARPAGLLATVGVVGTALVVASVAPALAFPSTEAMLLGAIVSSTDAAAVFSVLRGSGIHIK